MNKCFDFMKGVTYWSEERGRAASLAVALEHDVVRSWCDPRPHVHPQIVGIDFGVGQMHYHYLYGDHPDGRVEISKARGVIAGFQPRTLVVCEDAHLATPQTGRSLAQPFTEDELLDLYETCRSRRITIKTFPHHHSRKAREWAAGQDGSGVERDKHTDANDARALAYYVRFNNGVALSDPPESFGRCSARDYGAAVRMESNIVLNAARVNGYKGQVFPHVAELASRIAREFWPGSFMIDNENNKVAFSVASLVICEREGEPMKFVHCGRVPGWGLWRRNVLLMTACHHGGGVARSNICWHRFRPFLAQFALDRGVKTKDGNKYIKFGDFTPDQESVRRAAWAEVRRQIRRAYQIACNASRPFASYEIMEGIGHGR